jgi:hypothetical protein
MRWSSPFPTREEDPRRFTQSSRAHSHHLTPGNSMNMSLLTTSHHIRSVVTFSWATIGQCKRARSPHIIVTQSLNLSQKSDHKISPFNYVQRPGINKTRSPLEFNHFTSKRLPFPSLPAQSQLPTGPQPPYPTASYNYNRIALISVGSEPRLYRPVSSSSLFQWRTRKSENCAFSTLILALIN